MVIAIVTRKAVILYDTQQLSPFAVISNMHYACLTDIAWSQDGRLLAVSSIDGYCSLLSFESSELGSEYVKEESEPEIEVENNAMDVSGCEQLETDCVTPNKAEEIVVKPKRPNILEQWTIKTPKRLKMENGCVSTETKSVEDDLGVKPAESASPKRNSDAKPIEVHRKPKEPATVFGAKPIEVRRKTSSDSNSDTKPIEIRRKSANSEAKPIEVRRKPKETISETKVIEKSLDVKDTSTSTVHLDAKPIEIRRKPKDTPNKQKPDVKMFEKQNSDAKPIAVRRKNKTGVVAPADASTPGKTKQNNSLLNFLKKSEKTPKTDPGKEDRSTKVVVVNEEAQEPWMSKSENKQSVTADIIDLTDNSVDMTLHLDESQEENDKEKSTAGDTQQDKEKHVCTVEDAERRKNKSSTIEIVHFKGDKTTADNKNASNSLEIELCVAENAEKQRIVVELSVKESIRDVSDLKVAKCTEEKTEIATKNENKKIDPETPNVTNGKENTQKLEADETKMEIDEEHVNGTKDKYALPEDKNIQSLKSSEVAIVSPGKEKRRIPLITLSSPKNKKKTSD